MQVNKANICPLIRFQQVSPDSLYWLHITLFPHQSMTSWERMRACSGDLCSRWTGWHFGYASSSKPVPNKSESDYRELPSLCSFYPRRRSFDIASAARTPFKSLQIYSLSDSASVLCSKEEPEGKQVRQVVSQSWAVRLCLDYLWMMSSRLLHNRQQMESNVVR